MKTSSLIFLLCVILTNTVSAAQSSTSPPAVIDTLGHPVTTAGHYYIKPANSTGKYRIGGGLGLRGVNGNESDSSCPLCVIQEIIELRDGLSLTFYPAVKPEDGVVRVSTDMNVEFNFPDTCDQPTVWRLQKTKGKKFVNLGGEIGNLGRKTLNNWFKIQRIDGDELKYKFVYCPDFAGIFCKNIGIIEQNGKRRLAIANKAYEIVFES